MATSFTVTMSFVIWYVTSRHETCSVPMNYAVVMRDTRTNFNSVAETVTVY